MNEELNPKLKTLKEQFGDTANIEPTLVSIKKFFENYFNHNIIKVGDKMTFDFTNLFKVTSPDGNLYRRFKGNPIQPITITYIRNSVAFFTYDNETNGTEEYFDIINDVFEKYLYFTSIRQSELFKNKEYLKDKDYNEWYLQVNLLNFKKPNCTKFEYIKDIKED